MDTAEIIKEEYAQKWSYIRHSELQSEKMIQWYFVFCGALLAFLFKDIDSLSTAVGGENYILVMVFLFLYSISILIFILYKKKNYKYYTDRLIEIEFKYCDYKLELPQNRIFTAFRTRYFSISLVGGGMFFLLIYIVDYGFLYASLAYVLFVLLALSATFLPNFRH